MLIFSLLVLKTSSDAQSPLKLWYAAPAETWEATLPLGNGRLGMMPDGGVSTEKIVLNDITLWSGSPQDANNWGAYQKLPVIRKLILEGKNDTAQEMANKDFICAGPGSSGARYGCYQVLGDLRIAFTYKGMDSAQLQYTNYRRELSLENAIATCSYTINGVTYKREYFTSFGDDIAMIKISASRPGMLNCKISLDRPDRYHTVTRGDMLEMSGQLDNGTDGRGMRYLAKLKARLKGGKLHVGEHALEIKNATELILFISAGTDFRNASYEAGIDKIMEAAEHKTYAEQKKDHVANYRKLFDRVSLHLGDDRVSNLPTDQRIKKFSADPAPDNELAVLFFQYGRYLEISSTRVGLLPPNLQGLWANQVHTPWNGDYHLDVNVQMDNWPDDVCNLPELDLPLTELTKGLVKPGGRTAKAYFNADGWIAHVITNVWGYTAPGEGASWGISLAGSGWLCDNLWQHYAFTQDTAYLKSIYPVLKGAAQFYSGTLIRDPQTGWLVLSPSSSPENTFYLPGGRTASICMGATIDNQIMRELFENVCAASRILDRDNGFRDTLEDRLKRIPPAGQVSKDGSLMEWLQDYQQTDLQHRHISHLYGLYPATLITPEATPALAAACKKTLEARGDDGPSWSLAYKMLWWARLHEGDSAYRLFRNLLRPTGATGMNYGAGGGVYPNLLSAGPPFQIDGNFGGTAAIAEMLLQSHAGFIQFLPALPDRWESGRFAGLRVRGNAVAGAVWKDHRLQSATLQAKANHSFRIKLPANLRYKLILNGKRIYLTARANIIDLPLKKGETAELLFEP